MNIICKLIKYLMYGFAIMAGSLVIYFIIDGTRPNDVLFWGFLATMFLAIGKSWESDYA